MPNCAKPILPIYKSARACAHTRTHVYNVKCFEQKCQIDIRRAPDGDVSPRLFPRRDEEKVNATPRIARAARLDNLETNTERVIPGGRLKVKDVSSIACERTREKKNARRRCIRAEDDGIILSPVYWLFRQVKGNHSPLRTR